MGRIKQETLTRLDNVAKAMFPNESTIWKQRAKLFEANPALAAEIRELDGNVPDAPPVTKRSTGETEAQRVITKRVEAEAARRVVQKSGTRPTHTQAAETAIEIGRVWSEHPEWVREYREAAV